MTRDEKIDKIYDTLIGNEALRQKGLIQRVEELELKAEADRQLRNKLSGGVIVLSFIGSSAIAVVAWIMNKIF